MKKVTEHAPRTGTLSSKKFLAQKRAAYFVWHRSFQSLGAEFFQKVGVKFKAVDTHFLPAAFAVDEFNLRELLTLKQNAWGLSEVWYRLLKKRLTAVSRKPDSLKSAFETLLEFPFEHWPGKKARVNISAESQKSTLRNAAELRETLKKVLLKKGFDPDALDDSRGFPIKISLWRDTLSVYLPLSFQEHWQRVYKKNMHHVASLREDIAQCLLLKYFAWLQCDDGTAGRPQIFFVPFFGSGTFYFESVTMLWNIAHLLIGKYEGFTSNELAPVKTIGNLRKRNLEAVHETATKNPLHFFAQELDPKQIESFRANDDLLQEILPQGTREFLKLELNDQDFFKTSATELESFRKKSSDSNAHVNILLNPPFGNRIGSEAATVLYHRIGTKISTLNKTTPLQGLILCPDQKASEAFLHAIQTHKRKPEDICRHFVSETLLFQFGSLDARLVLFKNSHHS